MSEDVNLKQSGRIEKKKLLLIIRIKINFLHNHLKLNAIHSSQKDAPSAQ